MRSIGNKSAPIILSPVSDNNRENGLKWKEKLCFILVNRFQKFQDSPSENIDLSWTVSFADRYNFSRSQMFPEQFKKKKKKRTIRIKNHRHL